MKTSVLGLILVQALVFLPGDALADRLVRHALPEPRAGAARHLSPAAIPEALRSRSTRTKLLKQEASFDYVNAEGSAKGGGSSFVTTMTVGGGLPILSLEDLEPDLQEVTCSDSEIYLLFSSHGRLEEVREELANVGPFVAITSHFGCNNDDERSPHCVESISVDEDNDTIELSKTNCKWENAFTNADISFFRESASGTLRRRRETNRLASRATPTIVEPHREYPSVTAEPENNSSDSKLDMDLVDTKVLPPEISGIDVTSLGVIPEGMLLTCKKCLLQGDADISQGNFKLGDSDGFIDGVEDTVQFFEHGSVQLDVNDMFAQIELGLEQQVTTDLFNYSVPLPSIPITPFTIPGVVSFGIVLTPEIQASIQLDSAAEFSYGFNLSVPSHSGFKIDVGNLSNSVMTGFDNTSFNPLSFQSTAEIPSLLFSLGFTFEVLLGVHSPIGSATGGIGAFFNLPQATVNVTQVDNVDENCEPTSKRKRDLESAVDDIVGNFTHIVPSVELNMGPLAELEVGIGKFEAELATQITIAATEFELPTACLAYDEENQSYGAPSVVATPTGGAGDGEDDTEGEGDDDEGGESVAGRLDPQEGYALLWLCSILASLTLVTGIGL